MGEVKKAAAALFAACHRLRLLAGADQLRVKAAQEEESLTVAASVAKTWSRPARLESARPPRVAPPPRSRAALQGQRTADFT